MCVTRACADANVNVKIINKANACVSVRCVFRDDSRAGGSNDQDGESPRVQNRDDVCAVCELRSLA